MAKDSVSDWDAAAANNTDVGGINIQGSASIANGDNALRAIMAQIASYTRRGADLASASTLNLDSIDTLLLNITGSTTVTAVTLSSGHWRIGRATGAFQITAGASLIVNGSTTVNFTTLAGDLLLFEGYGSSLVRVWLIGGAQRSVLPSLGSASQMLRVNSGGTALEYHDAFADQTAMEAGSSTALIVTPGRQHFHPSHIKCAAGFNGTGTVAIVHDYNVDTISDGGTGNYTVNWDTDFSGTTYTAVASSSGNEISVSSSFTAGGTQVTAANSSGSVADAANVNVWALGDFV
jgi:hypothetical protein